MIKNAWSVLCTRCITDSATNNITLAEVVEQLNIPPGVEVVGTAVPIQMDLVTLWYRENANRPARGTCRIVAIRPDGSLGQPITFGVDLTQFMRVRAIGRIAGFELQGIGDYFFKVELRIDGQENWVEVSRIPLQVMVVAQPAVAQPVIPGVH
jgi:hypothetical protein